MNPKKLLILAGGRSAEHQISLISAWNVCNNLLNSEFELSLITIDPKGNWYLQVVEEFLKQEANPKTIHFGSQDHQILVQPGSQVRKLYSIINQRFLPEVDVVFPLLHGPNGEDGSMQGLLRQLQLPFIGPDVLGSAICMDKVVAKQLMIQNDIPTSRFKVLIKNHIEDTFQSISNELGLPLFIKPANLGSSVGISKAKTEEQFVAAVEKAFQYDEKIIVEQFIDGIEVECAVLGNDELVVSEPGAHIHHVDFFDYDTKYLGKSQVETQIPAKDLTEAERREVMELSMRAYKACNCLGLSRVDTFFTKDRKFFVNEINTLPGFTQHSMYPVLMEKSGIPYNQLIQKLCNLAIEHFNSINS